MTRIRFPFALLLGCGLLLQWGCSSEAQSPVRTAAATSLVSSGSPTSGNLLRNGDFQDDWISLLPENKNHHWNYSSEFYNRRDYNPDTWFCKGNWQWMDADKPIGQRRLVLQGPTSEVTQRVNWVAVHDDRTMGSFPDAGNFPDSKAQRSLTPQRLVRDLTLRVRLKGQSVPADAGSVEIGLSSPGHILGSDPMGTVVPPTASVSVPLPTGTFDWKWVEIKLPSATWLKAAQEAAAKDPNEAAEVAKSGLTLPGTASVAIRYKAPTGQVEVAQANLFESGAQTPNLLSNGSFEADDAGSYPNAWGQPEKYRYFPPGPYYIFNTWHNAIFPNRGPVGSDRVVVHSGTRSLKMIVAAGDEKSVSSQPVVLNQKEPRLIEATAWVKTDHLCMMQIDAINEKGERLDGFNFINKSPTSIGTNDWRMVRQVFRPRQPVQALRLMLCARGVNGYTLDDTGTQPQNNVVGTIWWDDVRLYEPESSATELTARGVREAAEANDKSVPRLASLNLGERMLGDNTLSAMIVNSGAPQTFSVQWEFAAPSGKKSVFKSTPVKVAKGGTAPVRVPYTIIETCPDAYTQYRSTLSLLGGKGQVLQSAEYWFGVWTTPIDLELGALYLQPEQKQMVRLNFGLSAGAMAKLATVRLELVRRGNGQVLHKQEIDATPKAIVAQRNKIPLELREDFSNLLLADLDVSSLPIQPFNHPQRNWLIRATALDSSGKAVGTAQSPSFCRQAHDAAQPPIQSVRVDKDNLLYVNNRPWMPWGVTYGHVPVYSGPADPGAGKYRDLHNLPGWSIYDRYSGEAYNRHSYDFNTLRYVAGSITDTKGLEKKWAEDNLYASSVFVVPEPVWSLDELTAKAGGKDKLDAYLAFVKNAPMVVSNAPGIEEAFGNFHDTSAEQLKGMGQVVEYLRNVTGKPVMVGHGGYWNRFEFEKVPYYDIYDPETEPFYPANLHTDLWPLIQGQAKTAWLRPQMYEDVPYERWRFHVYTELMRGARGWQIAHGPGDASTFRGLHGEMEFMKPIVYSKEAGPAVKIEPWIEHMSRRYNGKEYIVAATTHGITFGEWRYADNVKFALPADTRRVRVTSSVHEQRDESNGYLTGQKPDHGYSVSGIQNLPGARAWPAGSKVVQWLRLAPEAMPQNLVLLAKANGRWTHAASWGSFDIDKIRNDPKSGYWFLQSFYRHYAGFLGWGPKVLPEYIPAQSIAMGDMPAGGQWIKIEVPLEKIGAAGALLDGIGFMHAGGRIWWGHTSILAPDGTETLINGDSVQLPADQLAAAKISVAGLKAGAKIRVLFEDRELTAADGYFTDDFRGQDLYQRFGGGYGIGYGDAPVALHIYELTAP